jgi:hypothetical protein
LLELRDEFCNLRVIQLGEKWSSIYLVLDVYVDDKKRVLYITSSSVAEIPAPNQSDPVE